MKKRRAFSAAFFWENAGIKKSGTYVEENDKATREYRKTRCKKPFSAENTGEEIESIAYS